MGQNIPPNIKTKFHRYVNGQHHMIHLMDLHTRPVFYKIK